MNRILAGSGPVRLHLLVAIRSREGKHFRHPGSAWQSRGQFSLPVVLLGSSITQTPATDHTSLFALSGWSIARSQSSRYRAATVGLTKVIPSPRLQSSIRQHGGNEPAFLVSSTVDVTVHPFSLPFFGPCGSTLRLPVVAGAARDRCAGEISA